MIPFRLWNFSRDFLGLHKKLALLISLFTSLNAPAYTRFLVVHNQDGATASCPNTGEHTGRWKELWTGKSLLGVFISDGYRSPQDLSGTGSCVENFNPQPVMECTQDSCNYKTGGDGAMWLVNQSKVLGTWNYPKDIFSYFYVTDATTFTKSSDHVGKCVVCEGAAPIVVKHSYTEDVPDCPLGWINLYSGYSFAGGALSGYRDSGQSLSDTGSCLPTFLPNPVFTCWNNACDYHNGSDYYMWLTNNNQKSDETSRSNNSTTGWAANKARVSRCAVCTKY